MKKYKILLTRKSNRHKWETYLTNHTDQPEQFIRNINYLYNDKYYQDFQKGYAVIEIDFYHKLPMRFKNSDKIYPLPFFNFQDRELIKAVEDFINKQIQPNEKYLKIFKLFELI